LQEGYSTEEQIMAKLKKRKPMAEFDEVETRKAIYEMLHDETIRLMSDGTYRPRLRAAEPSRSSQN
jgi:hypothetical protein